MKAPIFRASKHKNKTETSSTLTRHADYYLMRKCTLVVGRECSPVLIRSSRSLFYDQTFTQRTQINRTISPQLLEF